MTDNAKQSEPQRLGQGWRKHIRRLKQTARRDGIPFRRSGYVRTPEIPDPAAVKSRNASATTKEAE